MTTPRLHEWEATGVTSYPITHPIVGQGDFYLKFKSFLDLVGGESNRFAHVFAVVAPWGVGKSRVGYEVVAQVNGTSKGWKIRAQGGGLQEARLFDDEATREKYLALYLRYSQVAHPQLNLDNWFAPAVYKALAPLARGTWDGSIQHQVARQSFVRLRTLGFDPARLAGAMELDQRAEDDLYEDTDLATRLCNAAFDVLRDYGIHYVVVVLDELETAAERATGGVEAEEARSMDGKAITMLRRAVETLGRKEIETVSKAVKEEDARARFPWLRFVVLCSPAIGDELKEVQSTDRRFEIVDLTPNSFSDVSTFVRSLEEEGRLLRPYPPGLVEAAYMMSGGNFGWFNVLMAVLDQVLRGRAMAGAPVEALFHEAIRMSSRVGRYLLDQRAVVELPGGPRLQEAAAHLLFGQQPIPLGEAPQAEALLSLSNAHGEPVAIRYHRVLWRPADCTQLLVRERFSRLPGTSRWTAPGIPDAIDLERLLDDLATLAVREAREPGALLLPGTIKDFLQLLDLVHPHAATEETGRVLWAGFVGANALPSEEATHIGPSIEMLRRLDIRLRKASIGAVFRDPDENSAYNAVVERQRPKDTERRLQVLVGALRLLDEHWAYDAEPAGLGNDLIATRTPKDRGLLDFKGLWLHPKGLAVLGWASSDTQLLAIWRAASARFRSEGRFPVLVFTSDYDMPARLAGQSQPELVAARDSLVVIHLNSGEESALQSIGLATTDWSGFRLRREGFTTRFGERLNRIKAPMVRRLHEWRHEIGRRGEIAWPLRPAGPLKEDALGRLVGAWQRVALEKGGVALQDLGPNSGVDIEPLLVDLDKLGLSPAAAPKGYTREDAARLWVGEGPGARPEVPAFLLRALVLRLFDRPDLPLDLEAAKERWLWGYAWDGTRPGDTFREWMAVACDLGWARPEEDGQRKKPGYRLVPRAEFKERLDAARNWLETRYPTVYQSIRDVLGQGVMDQLYKPGSGSKYAKAEQQLNEASEALRALEALEVSPPASTDLDALRGWFLQTTRLRLRLLRLVGRVFDKQGYEKLPPDLGVRTLALMDEESPLWERIRLAEHFANAVQDLARRVRRRAPKVTDELRQGVAEIPSFPIQLFTRPLSKLDGIVDPGLTGEDATRTTQRAQHAKVDTLAWYLKELRVADAIEALRGLAREVGVGETPAQDLPLDEIRGEIVEGWRDLRKRYGAARVSLRDLDVRIHRLADALEDVPSTFRLPTGTTMTQVSGIPAIIEANLDESLAEDIEELLDRHNEEMNRGLFAPLMREARSRLLETPEQMIRGLEARVRTIENAVNAWRQALLNEASFLRVRRAFNQLRRAGGDAEAPMPTMADLEVRSLVEGARFMAGTAVALASEAEDLLDGTGVGFTTWQDTVDAVLGGHEPPLQPEQAEALVGKGFLRRVYALPGGLA